MNKTKKILDVIILQYFDNTSQNNFLKIGNNT